MTAIEFNNISKQYRLGLVSTRTLSHDLNRWWTTNILGKEDPYLKIGESNDRSTKGESEYVWALRDIDFKVEQGDVLGIIGKNGAGKSTLLKILSKVTAPTTGSIRARGRIASLLEVGTGFHPEMTGRENIYMNGAIMGMTKYEISRKLDEIIDFSGCERYIDTPTKRYSSGMTVRLGFAIAAHLEPEILVVDEVLAVGDAEFQKKAIGKMQDVSKGEGRTVLFVSHNMFSIKNLCKTGVLLNNGSVAFSGSIDDTINQYEKENIIQPQDLLERTERTGTGALIVSGSYLTNKDGEVINDICCGEKVTICVKLKIKNANFRNKNVEIVANICNSSGQKILQLATRYKTRSIVIDSENKQIRFEIEKLSLSPGSYTIRYYIYDGVNVLDWVDQAISFTVSNGDYYGCNFIDNSAVYFEDFNLYDE